MSFNLGNHNFIQKKKLGEQYFFFNVKPENKKSTIYQITTTNLHRTDGINNLINFFCIIPIMSMLKKENIFGNISTPKF